MPSILSELLQAKEPMFTRTIEDLENASGEFAEDAKLTAEIVQKFQQKVNELGLDPHDSTGREIYHALLAKIEVQDKHLAESIGGKNTDSVSEMLPLAVKAIKKTDMPRSCWVLKKSVAKNFLRQTPPPNIMKRLGYTSVDSMLKKENLFEIYGALRFAESDEWLNEFNKKYKTLQPTDFTTRDIELVIMKKDRWGDIAKHFVEKKRHLNTHLKELGVVLILPANEDVMPGITTKLLTLSYHYYNEIRLYSAFFKLQQVKKNFGEIFVNTLIADTGSQPVVAGQHIHWRVIQRYFGKLGDEVHPEVFEPHVQPEDLHWRRAEDLLYQVDPEMAFWRDLDYVGKQFDGWPITMNIMDVALSYSNKVDYKDRYVYHFRESLWNEIFVRYMGKKTLENQILKQLDNDLIKPENL